MTGAKILTISANWDDGRGAILRSPQQGHPWYGPRLEAHAAPLGAKAGVHAFRSLRDAAEEGQRQGFSYDVPRPTAYAIVRPEGETAIGSRGWVAEAASITRIYLPPVWTELRPQIGKRVAVYERYARELYERYRVPVEVLPRSLWEVRPKDPKVLPAGWLSTNDPVPGGSEAGRQWLRLRMPGVSLRRTNDGHLQIYKPWRHQHWLEDGAEGPATPRVPALYDVAFAAVQQARRERNQAQKKAEAEEQWRQMRERDARAQRERLEWERIDQRKALEILQPYLPVKTVRVSSAQARGRAKQYSYYGVALYQIDRTADGKAVTNAVIRGARSDRRSPRLARQDAAATGRIYLEHIGKLSAAQAEAIREQLEAEEKAVKA